MRHHILRVLIAVAACSLSAMRAEAACDAPANWLPNTPDPTYQAVLPPHPQPDCPFYQAAWQHFLFVMQPDGKSTRFLRTYSTIPELFGAEHNFQFAREKAGILSLAPRVAQLPNEKLLNTPGNPPGIDAGINQAGPLRGLLIDGNGNPIYYAIHVNGVFSDFIKTNKLTTKTALLNADPDKIEFGEGAIELKSAWQIVTPALRRADYFITQARVPILEVKDGDVVPGTGTRDVEVALIAIHVVFVLKGHPEFIWATFEHVGANGLRDNAPAAASNAPSGTTVISATDWPLYRAGTPASAANLPNSVAERFAHFNPATQSFDKGGVISTPVYRMFPASKSDTTDEDDDISAVNTSMTALFKGGTLAPEDARQHYQLVGAIWLDNPARDFKSGVLFQNDDGQTTDSAGAMVAGEDRLSSTAMESFTQAADQRPNCFSCHNTKRVTDDRTGATIIPAKRLNVSHVLSKFLSELP